MTSEAVIPNIVLGQVYDPAFADAEVHYATLGSLADFFGREPPAHRHDRFYQLHFIERGALRLRLDDTAHAGSGPVWFLTPPSVPHAFATEPQATGHVLTVAQDLVWRLFDGDQSLPDRHRLTPRCVVLEGASGRRHARALSRLFALLRDEIRVGGAGSQAAVEALTRLILVSAFRLADTAPEKPEEGHRDLVLFRRFGLLLDANFKQRWTLGDYADQLHVTPSFLTDLCNRLAGKPPKQIVLDRVALEARRCLAFTTLDVGEIAGLLGFEDAGYFCRFFKRREGVTPSIYRSHVAMRDRH
jgi:AraC family 4-hydroxyphenylacetate 3-monooxygenase operon regulatory protein